MNSRSSSDSDDVGAPLPDFRASNIQLQTIAPALGVPSIPQHRPDYLEYDTGGRGVIVTMFANTGLAYLMGIGAGGIYGFRHGLAATPSTRFRVQLNSVLNHSGRYGSRAGNTLGVFSVLYSLYEGLFDYLELEEMIGLRKYSPAMASFVSPALSAAATGATYFGPSGVRVAGLAGTIGVGAVAVTYTTYSILGIPYGSRGFLFF